MSAAPAYSHELARRILERSERGKRLPGNRLPTERLLATELGVTRTMVRQALSVLEAEGRISREVGRGTFLRAVEDSGDVGPADVMAARRLIEPQVIPLVVAWATPRDFDEMRRCLDGGAAAESYDEFEVWDYALHHAIVVASRNALLVEMYGTVERARRGQIWGNLKRRSDSRERRGDYHRDHVELVEALAARETARAVELMELHLARVQDNLLGP